MAEFPALTEGFVLTHFIVSRDVAKSRQFYSDVLGGDTLMDGEPTIVALANSWIIINTGGGPTDDNPLSPSRRPPTRTGSAPSSTSASPTSPPSTRTGAPAARSSSPRRSTVDPRSAATCAIPTAT